MSENGCRPGTDGRRTAARPAGRIPRDRANRYDDRGPRRCFIDAVVSDFAPGAVEELVLSAADSDICIIEGQAASLIRDSRPSLSPCFMAPCPDAMILVHHARRTTAPRHMRIPRLAELRAIYESAASLLHPSRCRRGGNPLGCDRNWSARKLACWRRSCGFQCATQFAAARRFWMPFWRTPYLSADGF